MAGFPPPQPAASQTFDVPLLPQRAVAPTRRCEEGVRMAARHLSGRQDLLLAVSSGLAILNTPRQRVWP
jgi:hypothetical protein